MELNQNKYHITSMATAKNKKIDLSFQIKGLEILDIELKQPKLQLPATNLFHYNINIQHKINPERKLVFVIVGVNVLHEDQKTVLGTVKASCIFELENFNELAIKNDNKIISFPIETIEILNSVAISTTRGVMFTCFRGTFLHHAVLPLIDPSGFKQIDPEEIE